MKKSSSLESPIEKVKIPESVSFSTESLKPLFPTTISSIVPFESLSFTNSKAPDSCKSYIPSLSESKSR